MTTQVRVGLACFVWKDGQFLLLKRTGSHGAETWGLPGGHLELNESWEECAVREVLEESGLKIKNIRFLTATNDIFLTEKKHYITIWMTSDWAAGEPSIMEPDKCTAQKWCTYNTMSQPLFLPLANLKQLYPNLFSVTS